MQGSPVDLIALLAGRRFAAGARAEIPGGPEMR
jgi:hypothetical protein